MITTARAPVIDMSRVWLRPISSAMCMKRSTMLTVIIAAPAHASMKAVSGTSIAALPDQNSGKSVPWYIYYKVAFNVEYEY